MKKFALVLTIFVLIAVGGARPIQAQNKTMDRGLKWEAAVKPDVPAIPVQQEVSTVAAESASKSSIPIFYSTQEKLPPLPFNPFPDLDLLDLGNNHFAYDDRAMDYKSPSAATSSQTSLNSVSEEEVLAPSGPSFCSYSSNELYLNITSTNTTGFLLDVCNTTPGVQYGIGAKSILDSDPFNTWTLVSVFTAQSTNEQLTGTASAPTRFYTGVIWMNMSDQLFPLFHRRQER